MDNTTTSSFLPPKTGHMETTEASLLRQGDYNQNRTSSSAAHNEHMRQLIQSWGSVASTPPGCRLICRPSWRHFSAAPKSPKPPQSMTAAALLEARGTVPDFNPPLMEQCYLGADQPVEFANPHFQRRNQQARQKRQTSSKSSWATATTSAATSEGDGSTQPITFKKEVVRLSNTSSLLTASLRSEGSKECAAGERGKSKVTMEMVREFGIGVLSSPNLPEDAFETDSGDEA